LVNLSFREGWLVRQIDDCFAIDSPRRIDPERETRFVKVVVTAGQPVDALFAPFIGWSE